MASRETYTYALVKSLYDGRQDLLTTLRPFVLGVLSTSAAKSATDIKRSLLKEQAMDIPIHVIQRCAASAESEGLLGHVVSSSGESQYLLTGKGSDELVDAETLADVQRRVRHANKFLAACMNSRGVEIDEAAVDAALRRLIKRNLETIVGFVLNGEPEGLDVKTESAIEKGLAECISAAASGEPDVYRTLRDLVYGSVVLATLSQGDDQIIDTVKSPLNGLIAFADTNWIMGALELDTPARNLAASELLRLAKSCGIKVKILDFVLDETRSLLRHFEQEYDTGRLPTDPGSVFVQMKLRGMTPGDVLLLRTYIVDRLGERGIELHETGVDPRKFKPAEPVLVDVLMRLKHEDVPRRTLVDLAAIHQVTELRGHAATDLESARVFALTCDETLNRFNSEQMGHAVSGTYPEVVLDTTLTTVLWLKNPGLDVPLEAVVAAHSRGLLHKQAVWFQVVRELARAASEGRATPRDISIFLSGSGPDLIAESVTRVEEVTPEVVKAMVDQAKVAYMAELETAKESVAAEGAKAITEVRAAADASNAELQMKSAGFELRAERAEEATRKSDERIQLMEQRHAAGRKRIRDDHNTWGWVWAIITPTVFLAAVAAVVLANAKAMTTQFGSDTFLFVVMPLVCVAAAGISYGLSALVRHLTVRRGERLADELFPEAQAD